MSKLVSSRHWRAAPIAIAVGLLGTSPGSAQGTAAEREACTPDALRLCSDTIPDVGRTTACMKAHAAELSPRCHAVIASRETPARRLRAPERVAPVDSEEAPVERDARRYDRDRPAFEEDPDLGERRYLYLTPGGEEAETSDPEVRARTRAEVDRLCDEDMIDPRTCSLTDR